MQTKINQRRAKNVDGGGAAEDFRGDHLIFGRTKEGIAENFGRIQRGDHSNLFGKLRHWGDRKSY